MKQNPMRIGPDKLRGPNKGQKRCDWTIECRASRKPFAYGSAILLFVCVRHARQAMANLRSEKGKCSIYRVAKLTRKHRNHAYKGRFA